MALLASTDTARGFLSRWVAGLDRRLVACERRLGRIGTALLVAAVGMLFAGLYASENFLPLGFGVNYSALAENPFEFDTPDLLQYRIFAPVIGYYLGLRGNLFPLLTHGVSLLVLAALYRVARRHAWSPAAALGLSACMATSIPVLGEVHFPGMTDPISYAFLLLAILARRRLWLFALAIAGAVLNHESNLFALPWLLAIDLIDMRPGARIRWIRLVAAGAALVPFVLVRAMLRAHIPPSSVALTPESYLVWSSILSNVRQVIPNAWFGVFCAFKLLWLLPAAAAAVLWRTGRRAPAAWLGLVVACALAQLAFAEDITRLTGLAFPAVLAGAVVLRRWMGEDRFPVALWGLLLVNLLVPTVAVFCAGRVTTLYPLPVTMFVQAVFGLPL